MTRLTNGIRDGITARAVAHAFDPKAEALAVQGDGLAREAYAYVFPASETALVAKVPENWFRLDQCLRFNVGGYTIRLTLAGDGLPVPYRAKGSDHGGYGCNNLGVIPAGDLCDRIRAHAQATEDLKKDRQSARRSVQTLLSGVTTIKRLREVWPEGEAFFKPYEEVLGAPGLPAVRVDEVNAALGLS